MLSIVDLLDVWNPHTENLLKINIAKHPQYSQIFKNNCEKKFFWIAILWMLSLNGQFKKLNPQGSINEFFDFVDQNIKKYPDLFKDQEVMLAHQFLWVNGARRAFDCLLQVNSTLFYLEKFLK